MTHPVLTVLALAGVLGGSGAALASNLPAVAPAAVALEQPADPAPNAAAAPAIDLPDPRADSGAAAALPTEGHSLGQGATQRTVPVLPDTAWPITVPARGQSGLGPVPGANANEAEDEDATDSDSAQASERADDSEPAADSTPVAGDTLAAVSGNGRSASHRSSRGTHNG